MKNANKAIRKLKSSEVTCSITNLKNGGSRGAFIIFLYGNNKHASIAWTSRKLKRVVKSTLSGETLALEESLETCFMIKSLLAELIGKGNYQNIVPICFYTDNKSLVDTINSIKMLTEKRLQVDICVREMTEERQVKQITWCDSRSQLADCLTKVGAPCNKLIHVLQGDGKLL